jgi:hypothetical protein
MSELRYSNLEDRKRVAAGATSRERAIEFNDPRRQL